MRGISRKNLQNLMKICPRSDVDCAIATSDKPPQNQALPFCQLSNASTRLQTHLKPAVPTHSYPGEGSNITSASRRSLVRMRLLEFLTSVRGSLLPVTAVSVCIKFRLIIGTFRAPGLGQAYCLSPPCAIKSETRSHDPSRGGTQLSYRNQARMHEALT